MNYNKVNYSNIKFNNIYSSIEKNNSIDIMHKTVPKNYKPSIQSLYIKEKINYIDNKDSEYYLVDENKKLVDENKKLVDENKKLREQLAFYENIEFTDIDGNPINVTIFNKSLTETSKNDEKSVDKDSDEELIVNI